MKKSYLDKATEYAEEYGIIEFQVKGPWMIYYKNYFENVYSNKATTYKATVDLRTGKETRKALKKMNPAGFRNR